MAPRCKLLSLKVLDADGKGNGTGRASSIIAAIQYIQKLNGNGRRILVHGVNLSVGYDFEPEWFACGQSPLCVEVDRLVRSGVVVVVAAGNTGYGIAQSGHRATVAAGLDLDRSTIPATPTSPSRSARRTATCRTSTACRTSRRRGRPATGGMKPDLVAPGEKIISCAAGDSAAGRRRGAAAEEQPRRCAPGDATTSRTAAPAWPRRTCPA